MRDAILFGCMVAVAPLAWADAENALEPPVATAEAAAPEPASPVPPADAAPTPANQESKLPVALLALGEVDESLVTAAQEWNRENLALPVPILPAQPDVRLGSLDEVAAHVQGLLESNRVGIAVLWEPDSDLATHGAFFPERRVAIVNMAPLLTPDASPEKILARVYRQSIRAISFLMGAVNSPDPYSAITTYSTLEEFDAMGTNLDPPSLIKVQQNAQNMGIPLDRESPYNLTDAPVGAE